MDERFVSNLARIQFEAAAAAAAASLTESIQREWARPADGDDGTQFDPNVIDDVVVGFNRQNVGSLYATALAESEPSGSSMSLKVQSDYLAAMERAAHLRQSGSIRCGAHAAVRRAAHANNSGGVPARVGSYAQDLFMAGG